jgi:hypothetical protein
LINQARETHRPAINYSLRPNDHGACAPGPHGSVS